MESLFKTGIILTAATATFASATKPIISAVSWKDPRIDLFGVAPDASIWHKYYTGWDWQPFDKFEEISAAAAGPISVSSWGEGRFDILYYDEDGAVVHVYYGGDWGIDDLGGEVSALASNSWGDNRLDIVGKAGSSYVHKAWTGTEWYPEEDWEDFGGDFASAPAVGSWGPGRLDIIGISAETGSIEHKYWHEGWSKWEDLGGGPFIGTPSVTSWGPGRLDLWAIDEEGVLNHKYWDGSQYKGWEKLGGNFTETPQVVHWNETKIDIGGKDQDGIYVLKSFDGSSWNPDPEGYYKLSGPYKSEPSVIAKRNFNFLYVFGIDKKDSLRLQVWTGYDWQPGSNDTWAVGDLSQLPSHGLEPNDDQSVLEFEEL